MCVYMGTTLQCDCKLGWDFLLTNVSVKNKMHVSLERIGKGAFVGSFMFILLKLMILRSSFCPVCPG